MSVRTHIGCKVATFKLCYNNYMVIFSLFSWWYTTGWVILLRRVGERVQSVLGFFSVPLLLGSLFAPFRQISAGRVQGSLQVQLQAWGDRLFSRVIGAVIRSLLIIFGLISVAFVAAAGLICVLIWPFLPAAPLLGLFLAGGGV